MHVPLVSWVDEVVEGGNSELGGRARASGGGGLDGGVELFCVMTWWVCKDGPPGAAPEGEGWQLSAINSHLEADPPNLKATHDTCCGLV